MTTDPKPRDARTVAEYLCGDDPDWETRWEESPTDILTAWRREIVEDIAAGIEHTYSSTLLNGRGAARFIRDRFGGSHE